MLAIRLPPDIEARLEKLAKATGRSKTYYAREAIEEHLARLEDIYLAEKRLEDVRAGRVRTIALKDKRVSRKSATRAKAGKLGQAPNDSAHTARRTSVAAIAMGPHATTSMSRHSAAVLIGKATDGGDAPIVVQSMTNTDTADVEGTTKQVAELARAGSE